MSKIREHIETVNNNNRKALSIFLSAGYPSRTSFIDAAKTVIDSGADLLEIGVPFGDSLADGPVVQNSFIDALNEGVTLKETLNYIEQLKSYKDIPILLMSSANPVSKYGKGSFIKDAANSGVDGLILPDIPLEEHKEFYNGSFDAFDKILLTTPTSSEERIKEIDMLSSGFVYCVSVVGTTGERDKFDKVVLENLERTYSHVTKNKMLIGFGIKNGEGVKTFAPYCDGAIVGSAVVKSLGNDDQAFSATAALIKELSDACG